MWDTPPDGQLQRARQFPECVARTGLRFTFFADSQQSAGRLAAEPAAPVKITSITSAGPSYSLPCHHTELSLVNTFVPIQQEHSPGPTILLNAENVDQSMKRDYLVCGCQVQTREGKAWLGTSVGDSNTTLRIIIYLLQTTGKIICNQLYNKAVVSCRGDI